MPIQNCLEPLFHQRVGMIVISAREEEMIFMRMYNPKGGEPGGFEHVEQPMSGACDVDA